MSTETDSKSSSTSESSKSPFDGVLGDLAEALGLGDLREKFEEHSKRRNQQFKEIGKIFRPIIGDVLEYVINERPTVMIQIDNLEDVEGEDATLASTTIKASHGMTDFQVVELLEKAAESIRNGEATREH